MVAHMHASFPLLHRVHTMGRRVIVEVVSTSSRGGQLYQAKQFA